MEFHQVALVRGQDREVRVEAPGINPLGFEWGKEKNIVTLSTMGGEAVWEGIALESPPQRRLQTFFAGCWFYLLPLVYAPLYDLRIMDGSDRRVLVAHPRYYFGTGKFRVWVGPWWKRGDLLEEVSQLKNKYLGQGRFDLPDGCLAHKGNEIFFMKRSGETFPCVPCSNPPDYKVSSLPQLEVPQPATAEELLGIE